MKQRPAVSYRARKAERGAHFLIRLVLATACLLPAACTFPRESGSAQAAAPGLQEPELRPLHVGSIQPRGWLKDQLKIQASGLSGHLDEFWPDVRSSGWIGGEAEGWERFPYWLDGVVPLAFQLDDSSLKEKVRGHINYILDHQQPDGWLGPDASPGDRYKPRDPWPVFVMMKALTQYHEATGDPRIVTALQKFLSRLELELAERPLYDWNRMRWQDGLLSVHWLYERAPDGRLLDLGKRLYEQGFDWQSHFENLPFRDKVDKWEHESHVVNNAMGVKAGAVWYRQSGDPVEREAALESLQTLDQFHGQVSGVFSGDECFAGKMPSQGTETCAVVEYLYSLETMAAITGDARLGDRIERVAFNALPAPFKPDMWARQYVQQANQPVARVSEERIYTTNGSLANVFGLETNYGCCTANMHQGWPKFVSHLWMKEKSGGLAAVAYAPCELKTTVEGVDVAVSVITDYPFDEKVQIEIVSDRAVDFSLMLRVPSWAKKATVKVEGEEASLAAPGQYYRISRRWNGTTRLNLRFPMTPSLERRFNDSVSVLRGPLVYSLAIQEDWRKISGEEPHADWEVWPTTPWAYALQVNFEEPSSSFELSGRPVGANPFEASQTPVRLQVRGKRLRDWELEANAAAAPPMSPVDSDEGLVNLTLIPYGAAKLRISEFPVLR